MWLLSGPKLLVVMRNLGLGLIMVILKSVILLASFLVTFSLGLVSGWLYFLISAKNNIKPIVKQVPCDPVQASVNLF
jgi:hypothetical protein